MTEYVDFLYMNCYLLCIFNPEHTVLQKGIPSKQAMTKKDQNNNPRLR